MNEDSGGKLEEKMDETKSIPDVDTTPGAEDSVKNNPDLPANTPLFTRISSDDVQKSKNDFRPFYIGFSVCLLFLFDDSLDPEMILVCQIYLIFIGFVQFIIFFARFRLPDYLNGVLMGFCFLQLYILQLKMYRFPTNPEKVYLGLVVMWCSIIPWKGVFRLLCPSRQAKSPCIFMIICVLFASVEIFFLHQEQHIRATTLQATNPEKVEKEDVVIAGYHYFYHQEETFLVSLPKNASEVFALSFYDDEHPEPYLFRDR